MSATSTAAAMGGMMAAGIIENPFDPETWKESRTKNNHSPSKTMSAAHAEHGHGADHGHEAHDTHESHESAIETFSEGISKIMNSVRIAVKKVFKGITGFFKDTIGSLFKSNDHGHGGHGHDAHGGGHDAHGGGHDAHAAPAAHH